jgi:uncharacterized protein (TIGR02001 family)
MKNKILGTVMGAALLAGTGAASAGVMDTLSTMKNSDNWSASVGFSSDYVFRGTTFNYGDASIFGGFEWSNGPWFAGVWATSQGDLDLNNGFGLANGGATMELDYYVGWADNVAGFDLMVMPLAFTYPGQEGGGFQGQHTRNDLTYELWTSIGRGFDSLPGSPYVTLGLNYAPWFFDHDAVADANAGGFSGGNSPRALYSSLNVAVSLPQGFGLDWTWANQDVGGEFSSGSPRNDYFGDDWTHWNVGLTKSVAGFDMDVRYHDNNNARKLDAWFGFNFALDGDIVWTISRAF